MKIRLPQEWCWAIYRACFVLLVLVGTLNVVHIALLPT
jgi:hypothetical protein